MSTPSHEFRERYGDEMADIMELHAAKVAERAAGPTSQDIKAALLGIVDDPDPGRLARVDSLTRALLMDPAWRRLRVPSLCGLTPSQLAECAKYALDHFPPFRKAMIERAEVIMTLSLLAAARAWHAPRRNKLLRDALSLVYQVGYPRATAIIKKAHRELHAANPAAATAP